MSSTVNYEAMKVGQLRALCKLRGLNSDERKEELIASLIRSDNAPVSDSIPGLAAGQIEGNQDETLTEEEIREVAAIVDEMRHLRKQWLSQNVKQTANPHGGAHSFVHQGYGTSRK